MTENITLENLAEHVEFSADSAGDDFNPKTGKGQSHWRVVLRRNGQEYSTAYSMGSAYRTYATLGTPFRDWHGKPVVLPGGFARLTVDQMSALEYSVPMRPKLADVLNCLVSDAQSVAHGVTFEEWASDFGYDTDSRKAEAAFTACRDTYFSLVRLGLDVDQLSELFQDY